MRTMQPHAELLDPFRVHLLQHLPVGSLVQLRSTCQAFRALVDSGPGSVWRAAVRQLLDPATIPQAADAQAVQARLRQQAAILKVITAGNVSPPDELQMELEHWEPIHWSPCDPKDGLSHYLLAGTYLISCPGAQVPSTSQAWTGHLRLPSPFGGAEPLVFSWHHWCWDDEGSLHLVYCCSSVLEPDHLCSMDVHKGLMVASYVLKSQDLVPRTSRQKAILRPLPAGCQLCVIINLPSLTRRSILTNPFEPELVMRPQWEGFTAAGQPVLVFVSGRSCGMSVVVYDTDTGIPLAVHKVEDGSIATLHDQRVAASPTQSLLALAFRTRDAAAANYWSTSGFHAVVLDLGSGKVHTVVDGFDSQKHSLWAEWDWAPSGLAAAFWRRDNYDADLCIWHVASQAVIFSTSCKTIRHAWSPDGRFCALLRDDELEHMLNLSIPNAKACPAEVYMEEQPAPDLPYKPHRSRTSSSFTFSPCSSYFLRVGGNCPSPTDVDQWRLLPGKAALEYQVVSQRIKPESRRPVVTWYQCAPLAGVYALLQHRSHLQIMSSAQARQLASWQVSEEDPQGFKHPVDAMSWSPDGRNLACQGQKGFTLFNFQALGE